jgi:ankyrin repeat protein
MISSLLYRLRTIKAKIIHEKGPRAKLLRDDFYMALHTSGVKKVSKLIKKGADINSALEFMRTGEPVTPLSLACELKRIDLVKLLLKKGAKGEGDPITFAARGGNVEILKLLVKHGYTIDPTSPGPRRTAAKYGNLEALEFLVNHGNRIDNDEELLTLAGGSKNRELFDYILMKGNFLSKDPNTILLGFVALNDSIGIQETIKAGAKVDFVKQQQEDSYPEEPLRIAVYYKNIEAIKTLLKHYSEESLEILKNTNHNYIFGGVIVKDLISQEFERRNKKKVLDSIKNEEEELSI